MTLSIKIFYYIRDEGLQLVFNYELRQYLVRHQKTTKKLCCGELWTLACPYDRKHETISDSQLNNIIGKMRKLNAFSRENIFLEIT